MPDLIITRYTLDRHQRQSAFQFAQSLSRSVTNSGDMERRTYFTDDAIACELWSIGKMRNCYRGGVSGNELDLFLQAADRRLITNRQGWGLKQVALGLP